MSLTISTILAVAEHAAGATGEHAKEAAEHEKSETPFFVAGVILVTFAICLSVFGFKKPDFPGNAGAARGVMALSVALVAAAMFSIVYVSA
jgi:quinol-cytochrome oxidoreductase complex cytochrome b subunit